MTRIVLLRLGDSGQPLVSGHGVLSFPAVPPDPHSQPGDALFCLRLYIEAGSQISHGGTVWTDIPAKGDVAYDRTQFYGHEIAAKFDQDSIVDINVYTPGAFCYYLSYQKKDGELETTTKTHFVVPPALTVSTGSGQAEFLPLSSISLQSVVSKWVGTTAEDWQKLFGEIHRKGYNMIHFTPLQQRGSSDSPYSICDQLKFDPLLFPQGEQDVQKMVSGLEADQGILSMTDVVFNHTADNSPWLRAHPEAGYNIETAPHLEAAMELDRLLIHFSKYMSWHGCPTKIGSTADLLKVMDGIKIHVLGDLKLWQYYVLDVEDHLRQLKALSAVQWEKLAVPTDIPAEARTNLPVAAKYVAEHCAVRPFGLSARYTNKLDICKFAAVVRGLYGTDKSVTTVEDVEDALEKVEVADEVSGQLADLVDRAHALLDEVNLPLYREYDTDSEDILENLYNRINYQRLDSSGPLLGEVTEKSPLTEPYFTRFVGSDGRDWALANNGWIWGGNPLVDFASSQSKCYLRREVIVWGDCVKLRYGQSRADSPYLWDRMTKYVELSARIFHGFRIDNCHSTPIHVGEAMLDAARRVNPNLYVVAELFTGSEDLDIHFVERLGISSLIREAMQAYSVGELSRLVHRHGGRPIGSFRWLPLDSIAYTIGDGKDSSEEIHKRSEISVPELVTAAPPHALFMDCTHDNETPFDKRTVEDTLPNAALVAFCSCATGTTMGYDECYPHLLNVVTEKRKYTFGSGIGSVKAQLNQIRKELALQSLDDPECNQMHVHHEGQYITVHRINARTGKGYFLISRTKFYADGDQRLSPIVLSGTLANNEFAYTLESVGDASVEDPKERYITPVPVHLRTITGASLSRDKATNSTTITLPEFFPQGSILVLSTEIPGCNAELDSFVRTGALEAASGLGLTEINALLYRCESEERDASAGTSGVYDIPGHGRLVYAGIQGWISVIRGMILNNDLAHPLASHLRAGLWALDYIPQRITKYENAATYLKDPAAAKAIRRFREWLESRMESVKKVPYFMVPCLFSLVVGVAYEALRYQALSLMPKSIQKATVFVQSLALASVQMAGITRSAPLSPFQDDVPSLAAGLPHFSYDFMRCWGRDLFISIRGLCLATGRYELARDHILAVAMTLKHGLIPNLLGSGKEPRYNARDAVWFFLQAVQDYCHSVGNTALLQDKVKRRFPKDDTWISWDDPQAFSYSSSIAEVVYEILSRHAAGISYREAHAGTQIDSQMRDEGFNVSVSVDWDTGLVSGGNQFNCGTWMDKMGESVRAGSKGIPGTPRDGADVEINGLLKSALRFVLEVRKADAALFPWDSVVNQHGDTVTFEQWNGLLQKNFERCFYIPEDPALDKDFLVDASIVNRRGIYKDIVGTGKPYEDYQLRGNFPIALTVAPELFTPSRALKALDTADRVLRGPVGLRTLDPSDLNYRPYYNNGEDSDDFATSKGRNYHQGPEWVWIYGYFLRAYRLYHSKYDKACQGPEGAVHLNCLLAERLAGNVGWVKDSEWAGLTELTNKDGQFCGDSSPTQAWSASCILDLYLDYWRHE